MAAMLMGLALTAFTIDSDAQYRRTESRPSASRQDRPSNKKPQARPSRPAARPDIRPQKPAPRPDVRPDKRPSRPVMRPQRPRPLPRPIVRPVTRPRPILVRPSYGTVIAAGVAANMAWTAVNMAIAQQNYQLANQLGLAQSAADANAAYLYRDGVFYSKGAGGQYVVVVPPAGAVVDSLPEDFETVTIDGSEYYKVDDTIYALVIIDGKACFEVIGQLYK